MHVAKVFLSLSPKRSIHVYLSHKIQYFMQKRDCTACKIVHSINDSCFVRSSKTVLAIEQQHGNKKVFKIKL